MRSLLLAIVLLAPTAAAATGVHVTFLGDAYAVTFATDAPQDVPITHARGTSTARRTIDDVFSGRVPLDAGRYQLEGRAFDLASPPSKDKATRVVFVGDMGTTANTALIANAIADAKPSLVLIGGDLSYAHGNLSVWSKWLDLIEPIAASVPMMPAYGNHEGYCDRDGQLVGCGPSPNRYHEHFPLPNGGKRHYAFDWGPVRVTVLDTEIYTGNASSQLEMRPGQETFLRGSLDADEDRWDVVMFHRPLRTTSAREGASSEAARAALDPILDGEADLVLSAHVHAYERALASENGTVYATSGGGGRSLYDAWLEPTPWLAKRAAEYHFLVLDITPTRIEARAVLPDGSTLDEFSLEKPAPPTPTPSVPSASTQPPSSSTPSITDEARVTPTPAWLAVLALTLSRRLSRRRAQG